MSALRLAALVGMLGCPASTPSVPEPPLVTPAAPAALGEAVVSYQVRIDAPHTHLFDVEATAATGGAAEQVWMLPVWTPGSYLVREYARHIEQVRAVGADGLPRAVRKVGKNRWTVLSEGTPSVRLSYRVYARELSVRTNYVDADFAVLNGAASYLVPVQPPVGRYDVQLVLPEAWPGSATGLTAAEGAHHYSAGSYDELVDAPIVAGDPVVHGFEVDGVPYRLVNLGGDGRWDQARSVEGARAVVEQHVRFWGAAPYADYTFLNVIAEAGGGLEHLNSSLLLTFRDRTDEDEPFARWLGLVSHELFHAWNVKRLRPAVLGPFDYEQEQYTTSLWVAEGLTSYYDDLLLVRGGLIDGEAHLGRLSESIGQLQEAPGRLVQPLTAASHDAWIKYYRPDENSKNSSVSYYVKGAVVGWLLDAEVRRRSRGAHSLDDVLRTAYARYSGEAGYTEQQLRDVISELAGEPMDEWLAAQLDGTGELDYAPALAWWGLRFAEAEEDEPEPWIGVDAGGVVGVVLRDTPAWRAGINVGDELIGVGGVRVSGEIAPALIGRAPGEAVEVVLARRGRLRTVSVQVEAAPRASWKLEVDPAASAAAEHRRAQWWGQH